MAKVITNETIQTIAADLNDSIEQLAKDIHTLATYLEEKGNRGIPLDDLKRADAPTYFLQGQYEDAFKGIVFYNIDEHYNGYMVRRNPPWMQIWCQRYGPNEDCEGSMAAWEALKHQQELAAKPKRKAESFVQGEFSRFSTKEIGIRLAVADLLSDKYERRALDSRFKYFLKPWGENVDAYILHVWEREHRLMADELSYRSTTGDLEATAILKAPASYYVGSEEINAVTKHNAEPGDQPLLDPVPPVTHVVHVRSHQWINCPESERVYIGRKMKEFAGSSWANLHKFKDEESRADAIQAYEHDLRRNLELLNGISELRGKRVLGCWCKAKEHGDLEHACHGDVLVKYIAMSDVDLARLIDEAAEQSNE